MVPVTRLKLQSRFIPVIVAVLLGLQVFIPYDGWLIFLAGFGAAWLSSYIWMRLLAGNLRLEREMRYGWAQVGDILEERFTLVNNSALPAVWVEVRDGSTLPDYHVSRVTGIGGLSTNRWHTKGSCSQRGLYRLGPTFIRTGDPLGIYELEIEHPRSADLLVTPPVVPLPQIEIASGGRTGEGRPRPNAPERTVSASMVREYMPGDSLRWVHWRTSARRDQMFVRLFDGTPASDWWIILDVNREAQAGSGFRSTEEHGVILAASLAARGLRMQKSVGLVANGENLVWQQPQEGEGQRFTLLRALATVRPGENSLADTLRSLKPAFGKHASLVIITPDTNGDWIEALLPMVWNGAVPTVLLLDPLSFGGSGRTSETAAVLSELGLAHYVFTSDLLDRPEARPGQRGRWDWRVTPTGRAIAVHTPGDQNWKRLE